MILENGTVFCDDFVFRNMDLATADDTICALGDALGQDVLDASGCYVVPGLVDIHLHGAMGADFSDAAPEAIHTIAQFLLQQGTTSFLGTTMALPEAKLFDICNTARPLVDQSIPGQAVLRGINLEGPFFSQEKRGAQNSDYIIPADFALFSRLYETSGERVRTLAIAPETEGALDFIQEAASLCALSLAHTAADYDTAMRAFSLGANHVTHLFNGMTPFSHRDPGVVGAAFDSGAYVELITDGVHIHPSVVRATFQLFGDERICLISDAICACGMADGQYELGGQTVIVSGNTSTLPGGGLAGSVTTLADCMQTAISFGIPFEQALRAATLNPAKSVGIDDQVGSLTVGKRADILVLNPDYTLKHVIFGGVLQNKQP